VELLLAMDNWNVKGRPGARLVFTTPSEFFAPFESGARRLFDFNQTLRGRDPQLNALNGFLADPASIVGVLSGRGGIGTILYLREDAEWHPEAAKEIPTGDVLIVADDAHRFDFLDRLMLLVRNLNQRQKVKVLLGTRPSGNDRIDATLSVRFDPPQVTRFAQLEELCSKDFVEAFLPYAMNDSHPLLAQMVSVPLRWLRQSDLPRYRSAGVQAAAHKNYLVAYGTANAVSYGPNLNAPLVEDVAILQSLARHPAVAVRYLTLTGIRRLGAHEKYEREAIEMLLASEVGDDSKMADEMCGAADYAGINKEHLSEGQIRLLLDKLVTTKEIDGHHTERFLAWVGEHFPGALFGLILRRLDRDAEFGRQNEKKAGFSPIPHHRFGNAFRPLQNAPHYQTFLQQIRDRFTTQPEQEFWLRELFWSIGSIDETALGVIDELVHRGERQSARIALTLLGGAPPELALSRRHFAVHVIEECKHVEAQLGVLAESVLLANAQTGPFNRTSGQPSPKYLSMKERSETLRDRFPQGSLGNRLFSRLRDAAIEMLNRERLDDEQMGFE
jgi:hypothetical protein